MTALDGDVLRAWLSNCDDIFMERPKARFYEHAHMRPCGC